MQGSSAGQGRGGGQGLGRGRRGEGMGPGGECVCSKCGHREAHQLGVPCYDKACPKCQTPMIRSG